jgi:hypothetical protein
MYHVTNNKTRNQNNKQSKRPNIKASSLGGMTIKHTEFCGTLDRNSATIESYDPVTGVKSPGSGMILPLNAGEGITFPWLNAVASRYEKYRFKSLRFKYVPSVSKMYGGALAMCPIYDPADPPPRSRRELYNAEGAVHSPVHQNLSLNIPGARLNRSMYVRSTHGDLVDANELRLSDIGYITVTLFDLDGSLATTIQAAAAAYGDVFVEYEVELMSPRVSGSSPKHAHFRMRGDQSHIGVADKYHSFTGGLNPEHSQRGARDPSDSTKLLGHSEGDTLALQYLGEFSGIYENGGNPVDYDCIQFKEPFTGLLTIDTKSPGNDTFTTATVNGVDSNGETVWSLASGAEHQHKFAVAEPITKTIVGDFATQMEAHQTMKVVADAGEVLAFAHASIQGASTVIDAVTNMTWTEMGEAALDLLIGLI